MVGSAMELHSTCSRKGLAFLAMGCVCLGLIALMGTPGMPDGRLPLMGLMALCGVVGALFCLCGLALGPVKKRE
jgi:hypothetical protein